MTSIGSGRRQAIKRLLIGIPYMIAYTLFLFPALLVLGIVLGVLDLAWRLVSNSHDSILARLYRPLWDWIGQNARWTLTGNGAFRILPSYHS